MSKNTYCPKDVTNWLKPKKVLVVGDFMLDVYTMGKVSRISPEAPVAVLQVTNERALSGGAGNAVLNLRSLGMDVKVLGRVGDDLAGRELRYHLDSEDVDTQHLLVDKESPTPKKNRMMADNYQLLRVDHEKPCLLENTLADQLIQQLPHLLDGIDVVAISDYGKGFLTPYFLEGLIAATKVPIIVDPKGMDFKRYHGVAILKPNLSEAFAAAGLGIEATLDEVADKLLSDVDLKTLMITRSSAGISIFERGQQRRDFPAQVHEVRDVTGAGDTVLAVITAAVANGCSLDIAIPLANRAAAIAIERVGCARVSLKDLEQDQCRQSIVDSNSQDISDHQDKWASSNFRVEPQGV